MTTSYYDDLSASGDDARRVGWRHASEQAYRFEVALDLLEASGGRVLDIGAGLGAFHRYMGQRGFDRPYLAVEREPEFVDSVSSEAIAADYRDIAGADLPSDLGCLVAIGALSGTEPVEGLRTILHLAEELRCPFVVTVVVTERLLEHRPGLTSEPELGTLSEEQIETWFQLPGPWGTCVETITLTDVALWGWPDARPSFRPVEERFEAVLEGPVAPLKAERRAWLAAELGLFERAGDELSTVDQPGPLGRLVGARLELRKG